MSIKKTAKSKNSSRKAQLGMSDLFLAVSIFVVLLGAVVFTYNHYTVKFESRQNFNRMQLATMQITELLVKSPGMPADWESNSSKTRIIGLAYSSRNISEEKVSRFIDMSYDESKRIFGTNNDFHFRLADMGGSLIAEKGYNATGNTAISMERRVLYNGENAILSFTLWS